MITLIYLYKVTLIYFYKATCAELLSFTHLPCCDCRTDGVCLLLPLLPRASIQGEEVFQWCGLVKCEMLAADLSTFQHIFAGEEGLSATKRQGKCPSDRSKAEGCRKKSSGCVQTWRKTACCTNRKSIQRCAQRTVC